MDPFQHPPFKTPERLTQELEERVKDEAVRLRRWRQRHLTYGLLTVGTGTVIPSTSLLIAGGISAGDVWGWLAQSGWVPLLVASIGGALAALLVFLRGWGVSLGMITFVALFALLVGVTRTVLGGLLPAMPGLVALFVVAGALVGYLTLLEEGD